MTNPLGNIGSRSIFVASHPSTAPNSTKDTTASTIAELNRFFPFDPYELPLSRTYIDGVYRQWDEVKIVGDDDEQDGEDSDSDEEQEASDEEDTPSSVDGDVSGIPIVVGDVGTASSSAEDLGRSFGGMSISPKRPMEMSQSLLAIHA